MPIDPSQSKATPQPGEQHSSQTLPTGRRWIIALLPGLLLSGALVGLERWGAGSVPGLVFAALLAPALGARFGSGDRCAWIFASLTIGVSVAWALDPGVNVVGAVGAWVGLLLLGQGIGMALDGCCSWDRPSMGAALFLVAVLLTALPGGAGRLSSGAFEPKTTAWMLDLSPASLVVESAGVDWIRHPAVYGPAGGDALGPDLRQPWGTFGSQMLGDGAVQGGVLAGGVLGLVGYVLTLLFRRRRPPLPPS